MYDLGDPVPLGIDVADADGVATNATTVTLTIALPDGTSESPTVTNPPAVTGRYEYDYATTQAGRHTVRWVTTGPAGAYTDTFDVDEAAPSGIISLDEAKRHLNIPASDTNDDDELRDWIDAASEWVESRVGAVVRRTITETVTPSGGYIYLGSPVISVTSMTSAYGYTASYTLGDWTVDETRLVPSYGVYTYPYPVTVAYVAGRAVVPASIRKATAIILKSLWETQRGGASPVALLQGGLDEMTELPGMGIAVWRAEKLLEPYLLHGVVA